MAIYMTARWQCQPGAEDKVLAALHEWTEEFAVQIQRSANSRNLR